MNCVVSRDLAIYERQLANDFARDLFIEQAAMELAHGHSVSVGCEEIEPIDVIVDIDWADLSGVLLTLLQEPDEARSRLRALVTAAGEKAVKKLID